MTGSAQNSRVAAAYKWRNRLYLLVFGAFGFVFLVLPNVIIWWGSQGLCPSDVTSRGKIDGTAWEVLRNDCGAHGGIVWQLRVIPDKGYSVVVMESRGGPRPIGWEQSGFEGTVVLSDPPKGEQTTRFILPLDPKGQPIGEVDVRDGELTVRPATNQ
jgi:hypothetical protein